MTTRLERTKKWIENNKFGATVLLVAAAIVGTSTVVGAIGNILSVGESVTKSVTEWIGEFHCYDHEDIDEINKAYIELRETAIKGTGLMSSLDWFRTGQVPETEANLIRQWNRRASAAVDVAKDLLPDIPEETLEVAEEEIGTQIIPANYVAEKLDKRIRALVEVGYELDDFTVRVKPKMCKEE
jgi:hypothetical protein